MQAAFVRQCCALLIIVVSLMSAAATTPKCQSRDQDPYAIVPAHLRAQLISRLDLYVEYQRTKQYDKLYELLSGDTIATVFKSQNKAEFVKAFKKGDADRISVRLLEFAVSNVEKSGEAGTEIYKIYGKGKLFEQGEVVEKQTVIAASFEKGDWHFSVVAVILDN